MKKKLFKNKRGQSAVEFLILMPVIAFALIVGFQLFQIVMTSLVNQAAVRFDVYQNIDNTRGYAVKLNVKNSTDPIYPALESFNKRDRAKIEGHKANNNTKPYRPYFAKFIEEQRGSGEHPKRYIQTVFPYQIEVVTKYGLCEYPAGEICSF